MTLKEPTHQEKYIITPNYVRLKNDKRFSQKGEQFSTKILTEGEVRAYLLN